MSLFIGLLAFPDPTLQDEVKVGVLVGSLASAVVGATLLKFSRKREAVLRPSVTRIDIRKP
jgi:NhaA family Na+:H+ antiporter